MDINEMVNLGVSVCLNAFFIKYFFSEHKKMCENVGKMVNELINMNTCVNKCTEKIEKMDDNITELKKVS